MRVKRLIKFLERPEVERIIDGIEGERARDVRDRALLEVLFSTGMRISEALSITCKQAYGHFGVPDTVGIPIVGKGGYQRVVFFSPKAQKAIVEYLPKRASRDPRLFPITPRAAQNIIRRRAGAAGFSDRRVTPHTFRHSLATHLLREGANIRVVQEILGHKALSSTMVYTGVANKDLLDAHKRFMN